MPRLTKRSVESFALEAKPVIVWDDQLMGFGVKILPTGRRIYLCKYRSGGGRSGRIRWYSVGAHGALTCDQARDMATQVLAAVARGEDPQQARETGRQAPTVWNLWQKYREEHLPRKKLKSQAADEWMADQYVLPSLGKLKVADVTRSDVQALHASMADRPYQANRPLALISKLMNLAELWNLRQGNSNPCRHIRRYPEEKRQRYLSHAEMVRLGVVLHEHSLTGELSPYAVATIRLLLITGARVSEIRDARWSWFSEEDSCLKLPDSKTGAKPIFLSPEAIEVLGQLRALPEADDNDFIMKGRIAGQSLVNLAKPWKLICGWAELEGVRLHDLRHTAASIGVGQGLSLPIIGRLLGHSQAQTTQRYAHVDINPALVAAGVIGRSISAALDEGRRESAAKR